VEEVFVFRDVDEFLKDSTTLYPTQQLCS